MKSLLVAGLLMFLPLAMAAQTTQFKSSQEGEFASLNSTTGPNSSFNLQVSRNSATAAGTSATVSYVSFTFAPDFLSFTFIQIVGAIPASDFTGQNTQNLVLSFNTSDLDPNNSFSQSCTFDLVLFTTTCGPVPAGTIQLAFQENGAQRTRVLALGEEITNGPITTRIHQRSDNSTANAQGTVFGATVSSTAATVGINHNSSIEVITAQ
jgi:hypothetical protein